MSKKIFFALFFAISYMVLRPLSVLATNSDSQQTKIAVPFIENVGQFDKTTLFASELMPGTVSIKKSGIFYSFPSSTGFIEVPVAGKLNPKKGSRAVTTINYFVGDKSKWRRNVATYNSIDLGNVFPGVRVELQAKIGTVEKILTVSPRAVVQNIAFRVPKGFILKQEPSGALSVSRLNTTEPIFFQFSKPSAFQQIDGKKVTVTISYRLINSTTYGFSLGPYDHTKQLIIDPEFDTLVASTYLGGTGSINDGSSIALDSNGNIFVYGETNSSDFPSVPGGYATSLVSVASRHPFVAKFNRNLTQLLALTYVAGTGNFEVPVTVKIGLTSNMVYLFGYTNSTDYPTTTGAYQIARATSQDFVVSKLSNDLSSLVASTYFGGNNAETALGNMILDSSENVVWSGYTASTNYATTTPTYLIGTNNAVVTKLSSDLTTLVASRYIQASSSASSTLGVGICADGSGNYFVLGQTDDESLPIITGGVYQTTHAGHNNFDYYIAKLNSDFSTVQAATYFGGSGIENSNGLCEVALNGDLYLGVATQSSDFPLTVGAYDTTKKGGTQFSGVISRFSSDLTTLRASTLYQSEAGGGPVSARGFGLDGFGNVIFFGRTTATDIPIVSGSYQQSNRGSNDYFIAKFNPSLNTLIGSTYFGGSGSETYIIVVNALAIDKPNNAFFWTGGSTSSNFPVSTDGYARTLTGTQNVTVTYLLSSSTISNLSPATTTANAPFTLTITGTAFAPSSTVEIDGAILSSQYVTANSSTQITVAVPASAIPVYGSVNVVVATAGRATSTASSLSLENPVPTVSAVSPDRALLGSGTVALTLTGTNFAPSSVVYFGGTALSTTYVSATTLTASLPNALYAVATNYSLSVTNPAPGGGTSGTVTFTTYNGSGGGSSAFVAAPPTAPQASNSNPQGGFGFILNKGLLTTISDIVVVNPFASSDITRMSFSINDASFSLASQIPFAPTTTIRLCGNFITCTSGKYIVYAKFYSPSGVASNITSSTIIYQQPRTEIDASKPPSQKTTATLPSPTSLPNQDTLSCQLPAPFTRNLSFGSRGTDVKHLQTLLNCLGFTIAKKGAGSPGNETTTFAGLTRNALIRYQANVLKPAKIKYSAGVLDTATRATLK